MADERSGAGGKSNDRSKPRSRRADHEGTKARYDAKLGVWRARIQLDGQRRWVSGATQKIVLAKIDELRLQHRTYSIPEAGALTVRQYLTDWLENVVKKRRRASTYSQYESPIRVHVLPRLGDKRLLDLRPRDLELLYDALEAGTNQPQYKLRPDGTPKHGAARRGVGLAPKSIRNLHTGLHAAFKRAVQRNLIPRNPADTVELPALPKRAKLTVTPEDVQRLLAHTEREYRAGAGDTYALWCFLANTGLRIGEALALRWANVDLDDGWFTVEEDLDRDRRPGAVKTEAGEREVPMTPALQASLSDWRARQREYRRQLGPAYEHHDLVFATETGRPGSARNALRALVRACTRANVTPFTLHDFRRLTASLLVAGGVDIATAAAILGHRRASVLLDVYARALRAPKRAAANKLQAALYPAEAGPQLRITG